MPDYRFFLERGNARGREMSLDLPGEWAVDRVARHVARHLASCEIGTGSLHLTQDVTVMDADDIVVARYPLAQFLRIESDAGAVP